MGCDIHVFIEERYRHDGRWVPVYSEELRVWREYRVFAILANVRNDYGQHWEPISEPRGLPKDVSPEVRVGLLDNTDYHSHSWISQDEFVDRFTDDDCQFARIIKANIWSVEFRIVFAFDN